MSKIKEFYHEQICNGLKEVDDSDYFRKKDVEGLVIRPKYEYGTVKVSNNVHKCEWLKFKNTENDLCDGYETSNCCGDRFLEETDICSFCGEHAETSCEDCEDKCDNFALKN